MRKTIALVLLAGSYTLALGFNCIPNVGNIAGLTNLLGGLTGG